MSSIPFENRAQMCARHIKQKEENLKWMKDNPDKVSFYDPIHMMHSLKIIKEVNRRLLDNPERYAEYVAEHEANIQEFIESSKVLNTADEVIGYASNKLDLIKSIDVSGEEVKLYKWALIDAYNFLITRCMQRKTLRDNKCYWSNCGFFKTYKAEGFSHESWACMHPYRENKVCCNSRLKSSPVGKNYKIRNRKMW